MISEWGIAELKVGGEGFSREGSVTFVVLVVVIIVVFCCKLIVDNQKGNGSLCYEDTTRTCYVEAYFIINVFMIIWGLQLLKVLSK